MSKGEQKVALIEESVLVTYLNLRGMADNA